MSHQTIPPNDGSFVELLVRALLAALQKLTEPIPLFLLAICIIALLAAAIGGENLVIQLRLFLAFLAVFGVIAGIVSKFILHPTHHVNKERCREMSSKSQKQFRILRERLTHLTKVQFQDMMADLLTPEEQDALSPPITKGTFLNDMHRWNKLDQVQEYLCREFPDRFPKKEANNDV